MLSATALFAVNVFLASTNAHAADDVAEVAPMAAIANKAVVLGRLLANPLVPALLVSSMQQKLTASYGHLRSDKPLFWVFPSANRHNAEAIPVLPCAEGIAQFVLNHPGATRGEDGSVNLLAAEGRPHEMVVMFAADGYAAFAISASEAKKALSATAAARLEAVTKSGDPLIHINLDEETFAAVAAIAENVGTNRTDAVNQVSKLDATLAIAQSGIAINAKITPKQGVTAESLCEKLDNSLGSSLRAFGSEEGVLPVCKFSVSDGKVRARLSLPASEMKKAGKAFNAAVVQAMAPSQQSGKAKTKK